MSATEHSRFREDAAAYLLGALDDGERSEFERHAATCHVCQDELDRLRTAADALPRSVEQYEPPPSLKQALMEQVYAERPATARSWRPSRLRPTMPRLALAACALLVGLVVGYAVSGGGGGSGTRTISASVDHTRAGAAQAELVTGGTAQLRVRAMPQPRPGQVYEIWLQRGNRVEPASLFSVDRNGNGVGAVPGDLDGVDAVMVTRERVGGAAQPTERPLVVART